MPCPLLLGLPRCYACTALGRQVGLVARAKTQNTNGQRSCSMVTLY